MEPPGVIKQGQCVSPADLRMSTAQGAWPWHQSAFYQHPGDHYSRTTVHGEGLQIEMVCRAHTADLHLMEMPPGLAAERPRHQGDL